jgi:hypothetical protein
MPRAKPGQQSIQLYISEETYWYAKRAAADERLDYTEMLSKVIEQWRAAREAEGVASPAAPKPRGGRKAKSE